MAERRSREPKPRDIQMKTSFCSCAVLVLALLSSCQSLVVKDGVHAIQWRDIPIPLGMQLKTHLHRSDSLEVGDYRYANLVYEGGVPPSDVSTYMLKRMSQHEYHLVSQETSPDHVEQLVFERGPYTSTCRISTVESTTLLEIQIRTHPKL